MRKIKKFFKVILRVPVVIEIKMIKFYQNNISRSFGHRCIFYPSCSEYTLQAVDKYGIIKGNILGIRRILKCNPFSRGGVDYLKWKGEFRW